MHRYQEALASFQKLVAIKPTDADALNVCGLSLQSLKRFVEAVATFDRAIASKPDFVDAVSNRGIALQELGRFEEAVREFDFENQTRRIIAHCGLEWDDACLVFQKAKRAVKTASAFQVRQPLYSSSVGLSRRYLPLVQPLLDALGQRRDPWPKCSHPHPGGSDRKAAQLPMKPTHGGRRIKKSEFAIDRRKSRHAPRESLDVSCSPGPFFLGPTKQSISNGCYKCHSAKTSSPHYFRRRILRRLRYRPRNWAQCLRLAPPAGCLGNPRIVTFHAVSGAPTKP